MGTIYLTSQSCAKLFAPKNDLFQLKLSIDYSAWFDPMLGCQPKALKPKKQPAKLTATGGTRINLTGA